MHPAAATLSTLVIFLAPGLWLVAALGGSSKRLALSLGEQLFLTLAGSLLLSGWMGLFLAELELFSPAGVAAVVGGLTLGLAVGARKSLSLRPGKVGKDEVVALVCLCGFALAVYFPPFEYVLGGKDPGVYVNTGFHLAREGNLVYVDQLVRDIPPEQRSLFFRTDKVLPPWSQPRFLGFYLESPETGLVLPQGLHLYPVWIGMASGLFQMKSGLYATPFFALLSVAGFFLMVRRLFGSEVALWASGLLTVFQLQVWFARFPSAEVVLQFLYITGLLAFHLMEEKRSRLAGILAGVAFGSTLLVRLDSVLFLIPLGIYLGWLRLERKFGKPEISFIASFFVLAVHGAIHARLFCWPYVSNVFGRWYWRWIGENFLLITVVSLVVFVLVDRFAARQVTRLLSPITGRKGGAVTAILVFFLASYAYFIRPFWHGARTAPHDAEAFFRLSWYLYPMGVALAVAGAMIVIWRRERRWNLFLLVGLTFSIFFFYKIRVSNDHFFGMRRFIPVILPSLFVAIAVFLVNLRQTGGRLGRWGASFIGGALLVIYMTDGRPLWSHNEFRGSIDFVENLARHIGERDVVIFPRKEGLHLLELPLAEMEGRNVLEFYSMRPDPGSLEDLMEAWRDRYGDIYFLTNYKISLSGFFTRHVKDFQLPTTKYEYSYTRPPERAEPFHLRFTLSKAVDLKDLADRVPKLTTIDVGGRDETFVAWFHDKELEDGVSYRWSKQTSSVFVSGMSPDSRELLIRMAGRREAEAPPARVSLSLNDQSLGALSLGSGFEIFALPLSPEVTANLDQELPFLRLDTETWRPANVIPGATDFRDLGIRLDWIEVR